MARKKGRKKVNVFAPPGVRNIAKGAEDFAKKAIKSGQAFNKGRV